MFNLYIIIAIIVVVLSIIGVLILVTKNKHDKKCIPFIWKNQSNPNKCAEGVSSISLPSVKNNGPVSLNSKYPINRVIPFSFNPKNMNKYPLYTTMNNTPIKPPVSVDINTVKNSLLSSFEMPLTINDKLTGNLSIIFQIPLYSHADKKQFWISSVLDTGSNNMLIPTNICKDSKCENIFGLWNGLDNCETYNIYNPQPYKSYGSGAVYTKLWTTPIIITPDANNQNDKYGISVQFNGITKIENLDMPYFPPLCGLLPTFPKYGDDISFIDQITDNLTSCEKGFTIDLTTNKEKILFGKLNKAGKKVNLVDETAYSQLPQKDKRPILFYMIKLVSVKVNDVPVDNIPKYAILDTGTSGFVIGYSTDIYDVNTGFLNSINLNGTIEFTLENDVKLVYKNKVSDNNIITSPGITADSMLLGLPCMLNTVISYDLGNKCLYFN